MKISITQDLKFSEDANIKVDDNYLSITEPGYKNDQANSTKFNGHQIKLPTSVSKIFNQGNKQLTFILSIDKKQKRKLVCFTIHS